MENEKKICFIMCVNDAMYEEEALRFIRQLDVPEGYCIDQLSVYEAESMAAGYNEAMHSTDAKYKVYMHQDVFIVNKHFLYDLLAVFADESIGALGMVGASRLPEDGIMWHGDRVGRLYTCNINEAGDGAIRTRKRPVEDVEAVDGLLFATQYDIIWREDLFQGWDFYDVSQSMEFLKKGYRVVVPYQEEPWCLHDDGSMDLDQYERWRTVFLREYGGR